VIIGAADCVRSAPKRIARRSEILEQLDFDVGVNKGSPMFRAKHDVEEDVGKRLRHVNPSESLKDTMVGR
jgi:hypothetical protein